MLDWSAILACMPVEFSSAMPDPDDFDAQLRDLTSGQAEPAKFTELSAAERAKRAPGPPPPAKLSWRKARKARQLRRPVGDQGLRPPGGTKGRAGPGGAKGRPKGSSFSAQRKPSPSGQRRRKVVAIARTVGILIAFAALLYGLHLLGFGPQ
jgi:hypothetical protein